MNDTEREAIILNSAWEMIDDMVNWEIFVKNEYDRPTNLMFGTRSHSRLFAILLNDFLSQIGSFKGDSVPLGLLPVPSGARLSDLTFLFHLRQVCGNPQFGTDTRELSAAVESFSDWLEGEFTASKVNLPSINIIADLQIARYRYIKMCGDIAKHNLGRLENNVRYLCRLLKSAGHSIGEQEGYLAIENFFEWFHEDIFIYHSSMIAEFLNNIRWSIYNYLQPEFRRSWHMREDATPDLPMYSYHVPSDIKEPVAVAMYWDAMNRSRSKPFVRRFVISQSMKERY